MKKEEIALELLRSLIEESDDVEFSLAAQNAETGKHYRITVRNADEPTSKVGKLLESVLYPAASGTCKLCGK